jgi:Tfp pilus assembly protein PilO
MAGLNKMRVIFMVLLAAFLIVDLGLGAYLLWPGASDHTKRAAEEQQLQQQLILKTRDVAPFLDIDRKLVDTRAQIKKFYNERIPAYWSQIASELHKLETANGVSEPVSIRYKAEDVGLPNLQQVEVETAIAGDYTNITRFINAVERDRLLFVIEGVSVSGQPAGTVQVQIRLQTFLKGAA